MLIALKRTWRAAYRQAVQRTRRPIRGRICAINTSRSRQKFRFCIAWASARFRTVNKLKYQRGLPTPTSAKRPLWAGGTGRARCLFRDTLSVCDRFWTQMGRPVVARPVDCRPVFATLLIRKNSTRSNIAVL